MGGAAQSIINSTHFILIKKETHTEGIKRNKKHQIKKRKNQEITLSNTQQVFRSACLNITFLTVPKLLSKHISWSKTLQLHTTKLHNFSFLDFSSLQFSSFQLNSYTNNTIISFFNAICTRYVFIFSFFFFCQW